MANTELDFYWNFLHKDEMNLKKVGEVRLEILAGEYGGVMWTWSWCRSVRRLAIFHLAFIVPFIF